MLVVLSSLARSKVYDYHNHNALEASGISNFYSILVSCPSFSAFSSDKTDAHTYENRAREK